MGRAEGTVAGLADTAWEGAVNVDGVSDVEGAREVWELRTHAEKGGFFTRTQSSFVSTRYTGVPVATLTTASPKGVLVEKRTESRKVINWCLSGDACGISVVVGFAGENGSCKDSSIRIAMPPERLGMMVLKFMMPIL
jgi:hypothetical protein